MKIKRVSIVISVLCLVLVIAALPIVGACAKEEAPTPTPAEKYAGKVSHTYAPGTCWAVQNELMKEYLEKATDGRLEVQIFPSGTLHATYEEGLQACIAGTTQFAFINVTTPQRYDPRWTCFTAPGVVWGFDHWKAVQQTDIYKAINEDMAKNQGVRVFYWGAEGLFGDIPWNTERPLVTPDDWKGLKMRTAPSPLQEKTVEALGATPIPLGTAETLAAITEEVVDGGIISGGTAISAWSAHETLPYCTRPANGFSLSNMWVGMFINVEWWDSLPDDIKADVEAAIPDLVDASFASADAFQKEHWQKYVDAGNTVTYLTGEETQVWADIIKEKVNPFVIEEFGCEEIFAAVEAVKP